MDPIKKKQDEILFAIGLKRHMVWQAPDFYIYDESKFRNYVPKDYKDSERQQSDEFYGMFEFNLIHINSGIRISYITSESYDGEVVEYNMKDIFIITKAGKHLTLVDIDFRKKMFLTTDKQIHFSNVNMLVD